MAKRRDYREARINTGQAVVLLILARAPVPRPRGCGPVCGQKPLLPGPTSPWVRRLSASPSLQAGPA